MKHFARILIIAASLMMPIITNAQSSGNDVFVPISKYISTGNVEALSVWFADNLELSIFSKGNITSRDQAKLILSRFFDSYTPRSLEINHTAAKANMKTALGMLNAGGEKFLVTIFVSRKDDTYRIQQLKIDRTL